MPNKNEYIANWKPSFFHLDKDVYSIERTWHPEYHGYVYQPKVVGHANFIEPYTSEDEAYAFLKGYRDARAQA